MPAVIKRFEGFTGGGGGLNLFGLPELTASLEPVTVLGHELTFNDWLYYLCWTVALVGYVIAWLMLRGSLRTGVARRAGQRDRRAVVGRQPPVLQDARIRRERRVRRRRRVALRDRDRRSSTRTRSRSPSRSCCSSASSSGGLGSLVGLIAGAVFIQFLPIWSQQVSKSPGAPAVVSGVVLIALMFVLPMGVAGLAARLRTLTKR